MAHGEDSDSDMDLDMTEESENELNVTTYFHDDIEVSSSDENNEAESLEDDDIKESTGMADSKEKLDANIPAIVVDPAVDKESLDVADKLKNLSSEEDYREILMDIDNRTESKKNHLILCPVCYEIAILCKDSTLYDNLIFACMKQRSSEL